MNLFTVPNFFSLGNLLCGCLATLSVIEGNLYPAVILVGIAAVLDFLDGFAARGLKQGSEVGKQLDSLADMVTFGVVPGMVMFQLIKFAMGRVEMGTPFPGQDYLPFAGFLVPLFSGLRLAKFNVDTRQSDSFIGLPTLANALFICSLPLAFQINQEQLGIACGNLASPFLFPHASEFLHLREISGLTFLLDPWVLCGLSAALSFLLISPIPMFSFKIKHVKWSGNEVRYIFILLATGLLSWLKLQGLPLVILLYILLSVGNALVVRAKKQ